MFKAAKWQVQARGKITLKAGAEVYPKSTACTNPMLLATKSDASNFEVQQQ